jgi:CubicO group peptidase (beta-lactamase class C family)
MNRLMHRALSLCLVLAPALSSLSAQQAPAPEESLVGIWSSETTFGPELKGELTIGVDGSSGRATLANAEATFAVSGKAVRFSFPGDRGEFRGEISADRRTVTGFWIQPGGTKGGVFDQGYASPLVLRRATRGAHSAWRGTVRPVEYRFTLYLKIFRDPEGTLLAAFRNPERGASGPAMQLRVTREGDSVIFTRPASESRPEAKLTGTLVGSGSSERLRVHSEQLDRDLELTRRTPAQASDFFPRPPGGAKYAYAKPPTTGDGWTTARARDVGMDEAALARLVQSVIDGDPTARDARLMHSLLVARRGKLVLEEYFFGFDRDDVHDLRSAGKTFSSVLLGAAMMRGTGSRRVRPETPLYDLVAGMGPFANPDPRKSRITLAHSMTHSTGLACDDNDEASPGNEDKLQTQKEPDWWKYTLDLPVVHDPGTRYAYCSAGINLMGAALKAATNQWLPELFESAVARPLDFGQWYWNLMPSGEGYLGGGARLRPRDLLKVGQAYLDGGAWRGRRIVDASWVKESTSPKMEISPATTGMSAEDFENAYVPAKDAYAWHSTELRSGERTYHGYLASGNGGQLLIVVPELELAVVFTAGNYGQFFIWGRFTSEIVPKEIIPAIRR